MWNGSYKKLCDIAKVILKEDACMQFCDKTGPLYLETDTSGIGLGAGLLQIRDGINCL